MPRTLILLRPILGVLQIGIKSQDLIISDSEDSTITYTAISSPYEDSSNMGSPGVEGPPMMPEDPHAYVVAIFQAPSSSDYVPGPEEPEQAPPSHVYLPYVPEPVYSKYMPPEDNVLPVKEQPLPVAASPTTESPRYILEFDPEEDDEEAESFETNESAATPPPPHPTYRVMARMSIRPQAPAPFLSKEDAERFLALPTPPLSPLSPYLSPLPQIPSPPLPIPSPPPNSPTYIEAPPGFRAAGIRQRDTPPSLVHETEIPKICLPLCKRPCRTTPTLRYKVRESSAVGAARQDGPAVARADLYGFVDMVDAALGRLMSSELDYGHYLAVRDYRVTGSGSQEKGNDYRDAGSGPSKIEIAYRDTKTSEEVAGPDDRVLEAARTR
ncbi:hypothetical protein Tco_1524780 [Tanacetum coccineum]